MEPDSDLMTGDCQGRSVGTSSTGHRDLAPCQVTPGTEDQI